MLDVSRRGARQCAAALAGMVLGVASACDSRSSPPAPAATAAVAAARPRWTYLYAGDLEIRAEVAATAASRQHGLMQRRSLEPDSGMIFVFPARRELDFWMLDTLIPLSIAFLEDDGTIAKIVEMSPGAGIAPERQVHYRSDVSVRLALEMESGWFSRRGLKAGDKLDLGTLARDVIAED